MNSAVEGAGVVIGAVRGTARDLIAGAIAEAVRLALKWPDKISEWMKKLGPPCNLGSELDELGAAATSSRRGVDDLFGDLGEMPGLNPSQKAITEQSIADAARPIAPSTTTGSAAGRGFLAGGSELKPAFQG